MSDIFNLYTDFHEIYFDFYVQLSQHSICNFEYKINWNNISFASFWLNFIDNKVQGILQQGKKSKVQNNLVWLILVWLMMSTFLNVW